VSVGDDGGALTDTMAGSAWGMPVVVVGITIRPTPTCRLASSSDERSRCSAGPRSSGSPPLRSFVSGEDDQHGLIEILVAGLGVDRLSAAKVRVHDPDVEIDVMESTEGAKLPNNPSDRAFALARRWTMATASLIEHRAGSSAQSRPGHPNAARKRLSTWTSAMCRELDALRRSIVA